jgi:hypothetical protein
MVESNATNDVLSISAIRIGPRSERRPTDALDTDAAVTACSPSAVSGRTPARYTG